MNRIEHIFARKGLSLERLRGFLAYADAGSIINAAGGNAAKQALISRQIGELGESLGVELVRRQGRGIVLTEAGHKLAAISREYMMAMTEFSRGMESLPAHVSIACSNTFAQGLFLPRLPRIRQVLPRHVFTLRHEMNADIVRCVTEGIYDFGIVRDMPIPRTLGRRALGRIGFTLFAPRLLMPGNRGVGARAPDTQLAVALRLPLALPIGGMQRAEVEKLAEQLEIPLNVVLMVDSNLQAAIAVESGAVAAILPSVTWGRLNDDAVAAIPLPQLPARRHLLIWSKRAERTRASVAEAVKVLPGLLALE